MRKVHSIIGLQVISSTDGIELGKVVDLFFDHDADQCLGLVLRDKDLFGLISPQVVPWENIQTIGKDAIMVSGSDVAVNPFDIGRLRAVWERKTKLSGTRIYTEDGRDLGNFSEVYLDEKSGLVVGYEVSGGFVSDTMSGKRYVASEHVDALHVGEDVMIASPEMAQEFDRQKSEEPGGLTASIASAQEKVSDTYSNIADASVEKQQAFVVGKTANHDVFLPAPEGSEAKNGDLLVGNGQTITEQHAQTATENGILHGLVVAAGATPVVNTFHSAKETAGEHLGNAKDAASGHLGNAKGALGEHSENAQQDALERAIGHRAAFEVDVPGGGTLLPEGMLISREIVDLARQHGKENEVIAAAGLGSVSQTAQNVGAHASQTAGGAWDTVKSTTEGLLGTVQDKKADYENKAEQNHINHALGRPVTRVILAQDDSVILNTGDIITNRAIERAREENMLDVLLDSVYDADPQITPEMMRATESGEAALPTQAEPTGGPITATVSPDQQKPSQDTPSQG